MANALTLLGYNVHDFEEHLEYNLDNYVRFFDGDVGEEVFAEMYADVDVVVDQPACTIWSILLKQFPEAKVILMERESAESWFRSYYGMFEYMSTTGDITSHTSSTANLSSAQLITR